LSVAVVLLVMNGSATAERVQPEMSASLDARLSPEARAQLWREASALEKETVIAGPDDVEAAVSRFERSGEMFYALADQPDPDPMAFWRSGRSYWLAGEVLPVESTERRASYYQLAKTMAGRGLELDAECAECMLWKFISMGRLRTTGGGWGTTADLKEMAQLLDTGIALKPTYRDDDDNSTLGNLHYSSAIFYRIFPDWFWIGWLLGVKGDKERAYQHAESALALHPTRFDFKVEVGTQLLCLGTDKGKPKKVARGKEVMRSVLGHEPMNELERRGLIAVEIMIENPDKACGYAGDTWLEIDKEQAKRDIDAGA
jgi:hypothetical protein